jgi:hypothetical protein
MYLIAPATIMFIGAEMHIDPTLLSAISALVGALVGGAPRRPPPSAPTLQRHKAAVAKASSLLQLLGEQRKCMAARPRLPSTRIPLRAYYDTPARGGAKMGDWLDVRF